MSQGLLDTMSLEAFLIEMALGYEFVIENGHAVSMEKAELN